MVMNVVVVYLIILISSTCYGTLEVGSPCKTLKGEEGICVVVNKCRQAIDDLKNLRFPTTCGFQGPVAIVCCLNNVTPEVTTKRISRIPGVISRQKCREYSKHVFVNRIPVLMADVNRYMRNVCDLRVDLRNSSSSMAITTEFPHMALVGFVISDDNIEWLCGGSLISEQYVLTTANCLFSSQYGAPDYVKVGITNRRQDTRHLQLLKIIELIHHPDYKRSSYYNDIGLLKLKKPIEITPYAAPACLYTEHNITSDLGMVTGWGNISYIGDAEDNLQKAITKFGNTNQCSKNFVINSKLRNGITDANMLCAVPTNDIEICQSDSGGPLQIYHSGDDVECMYDIVGIVSFGQICGSNNPGVYTRVSNYIKWIESVIWP